MDAAELDLSALKDFLSDESKIYWADKNTLKSSPQDFYNFNALLPNGVKVLLISASIEFSEEKPFLPELLGFDIYNFYKHPQKVVKNQLLIIATNGLAVQNTSTQDYSEYVSSVLMELSQLQRPILVLFTAQLMLDWTAHLLAKTNLSFQAQDKHQNRPEQLKRKFDDGKYQVLLGTDSFWEGVDFDKQRQMIVVIPRLPFATPEDILTKKFASKFNNPFYEFNLPMATLKMRQAIGRVNRKSSQKSAIIVLDGRLAGETYAKRMRHNLQEAVKIESAPFDEIMGKVKDFLC